MPSTPNLRWIPSPWTRLSYGLPPSRTSCDRACGSTWRGELSQEINIDLRRFSTAAAYFCRCILSPNTYATPQQPPRCGLWQSCTKASTAPPCPTPLVPPSRHRESAAIIFYDNYSTSSVNNTCFLPLPSVSSVALTGASFSPALVSILTYLQPHRDTTNLSSTPLLNSSS